jgi:uncharacterized protein (TIRG00374 family)
VQDEKTGKDAPSPWHGWRGWFFAAALVAALVAAVLHFGELEQFAKLLTRARPLWLAAAFAAQLSTYVSVSLGWHQVLSAAGTKLPLAKLVRVAVTKLFADQALPTAGMGGNVLLVDQLHQRGAAEGSAVAALLMSMIGFYAAFALFAIIALVLLWFDNKATALTAGLVSIFLVVAVTIPSLALWLRSRGRRRLPRWIERIGPICSLLETVAQAPGELLENRMLLLKVTIFNALIFLADSATLFACLRSVGIACSFGTAFIALIMAQMVVTIGPIPMGLGSFEATAIGTLRLLKVPFEAAFAATMLLRVLILWLPLLPGMWLMRSMLRQRREGRDDEERPSPSPHRASRAEGGNA